MSISESEDLLRGHAEREEAQADRNGFFALSGGMLALIGLAVVLASIVIGLLF